ncbi:Endonuclease/exonuclease/phosphatase [Catenaria anguillulae PL171]|uniref:Endonuclease/exonuclease/phosphatase n=1 Tax=Catenaria anguillulae PL171 TaxID=765915 RepID=A0A1Y2HQ50_9FUNG|nr:Endonuclease/exonuclease/phosphatase [Catenaria anguillulae PL171]
MRPAVDPAHGAQPFEIITYDFRPNSAANSPQATANGHHSRTSSDARSFSSLKVVQWNIERGYCLDAVIEILRGLHADIICVQELDIGCARSGGRNCAREIAEALSLKCTFVAEFLELDHSVRSERDGGGGLHGNAIFSHLDFDAHALVHQYQAFDWERDGMKKREPRRGGRCTVVGHFEVPGFDHPLTVYSAHLEVFCGLLSRVAQLSEVLARASATKKQSRYQILCGDLNTMAHGIARLSPNFCNDSMRWRTLGSTEAEWLTRNVLAQPAKDMPFNPALLSLNLPPAVVEAARNPGFVDPWDPVRDVTLSNYGGYYSGKLDWTLCMGLEVTDRAMANPKFEASDHRALVVTVRPDPEARAFGKYLAKWGPTSQGHLAASGMGDGIDDGQAQRSAVMEWLYGPRRAVARALAGDTVLPMLTVGLGAIVVGSLVYLKHRSG